MPSKTTCLTNNNCCRLVRLDKSSRLLLPLARRSRPLALSRCRRNLCQNCFHIKQKQTDDLRNLFVQENENLRHEIEFSLINQHEHEQSEYESAGMLLWNLNTSENRSQTDSHHHDQSFDDTGSLTNHEKKILLEEAVEKLRIVLNHRSTSPSNSEQDQIEFTYLALQTTVNILSSTLESLQDNKL